MDPGVIGGNTVFIRTMLFFDQYKLYFDDTQMAGTDIAGWQQGPDRSFIMPGGRLCERISVTIFAR